MKISKRARRILALIMTVIIACFPAAEALAASQVTIFCVNLPRGSDSNKMNPTVYTVKVSAGATTSVNNGNAVVNEWLPARISVTKVISSGAKLSGASFTAYSDKDCKNVLTDMSGKVVVIKTDANGYAISTDLYVGKTGTKTIYVKETALDNPDADIIALNTTVFPAVLQPNVTTAINDGKAVVNEYKPGRIKVVKENENGNRLAGITFSVYTDKSCRTLLTTMVTDKYGVAVSQEISIDGTGERKLYVRETGMTEEQMPLYELSSTVYPVTIFPNQTIQANNGKTIINRWTLGQISLEKQNEYGAPIEGVVFAIYEDADCVTPLLGADGKQVMMTTGKDGKALSEGIEVEKSGTRKLYVKEFSMPESCCDMYALNETVYPVAISAGKVSQLNGGKPVINEWLPATMSLAKEAPNGDAVDGVVFKVYLDKELTKEAVDVNGKPLVLTTDEDGMAHSEDIKVGKDGTLKVFVKETEITSDWSKRLKIGSKVYEVQLRAGGNAGVNGDMPIVNEWLDGRISLVKVNEAGQPLSDVVFAVYEDPDCKSPLLRDEDAQIVLTTDEDGRAVSQDIPVGSDGKRKLYIREQSMPDEYSKLYELNRKIFSIEITAGAETALNNGEPVVNRWLPAELSLAKIDEDGNAMSDVVFGVFSDEKCTDQIGSMTTAENGTAGIDEISVGRDGSSTVYVRELSMTASDSDVYELNNTIFDVELRAGQSATVNGGTPVVNNFKTAGVRITKADVTTAEGVPGATIQ